MPDKLIDTNILVYAYDASEGKKHETSKILLKQSIATCPPLPYILALKLHVARGAGRRVAGGSVSKMKFPYYQGSWWELK